MKHRDCLTLATLICLQVMFFCWTFSQWSSMGLLSALVIGWVSLRHWDDETDAHPRPLSPLRLTLVLMLMTLVMIAWRFSVLFGENPNFIFLAVDALAHAVLVSMLLIWAMRPRYGHISLLFFGLALMLLCVAAGGVSRSLASQTTVGLLSCVGFLAASRIILPAYWAHSNPQALPSYSSPSHSIPLAGTRARLAVATAIVLMMATGVLARVTDTYLPGIQTTLQKKLQSSIDAVQTSTYVGGTRYVSGSRLGSVRDHLLGSPESVALRVYSSQRPGYLRGSVFDIYETRRWGTSTDSPGFPQVSSSPLADRNIEPIGKASTPLERPGGKQLQRFELAPSSSMPVARLEVHGDPMRGTTIFLPLSTRWVEARSSELTLNFHDVIRLGVDVSQPYVAGATAVAAGKPMSSMEQMICTLVAPKQKQKLLKVADRVFSAGQSARQKAAAIEDFFQSGFRYSLEVPRLDRSLDPLLFFLEQKHPAHCEYFASATVLLLRCANVPARYVTGYVADEYSDENDYWLARNRDAHAWAEAYDDQTGRWFVVESTPGRSYEALNPLQAEIGEAGTGGLGGGDGENVGVGFFSEIWGLITSFRATETLFLLFRYFQIGLLIGLVVWLFRRYRSQNLSESDLEDWHCHRMLAKVDRWIARHGFQRDTSETLYRFADRIELEIDAREAVPNREVLMVASDWFRSFADARYQGMKPPPWNAPRRPGT